MNQRIWATRFSKLASQVLGLGHNVLLFGGNGECFFIRSLSSEYGVQSPGLKIVLSNC